MLEKDQVPKGEKGQSKEGRKPHGKPRLEGKKKTLSLGKRNPEKLGKRKGGGGEGGVSIRTRLGEGDAAKAKKNGGEEKKKHGKAYEDPRASTRGGSAIRQKANCARGEKMKTGNEKDCIKDVLGRGGC